MRKIFTFALWCFIGCTVSGNYLWCQTDDWCQADTKICFSPTLIMPGTHVFFDQGVDEPGEFDLFNDGKIGLDVQLLGADVFRELVEDRLRVGGNFGFGTATAMEGAPAVLISASVFLQIRQHMRFDFGWIKGFNAKEGPGKKDDQAVFVGLSFPTQLGEALKRLF